MDPSSLPDTDLVRLVAYTNAPEAAHAFVQRFNDDISGIALHVARQLLQQPEGIHKDLVNTAYLKLWEKDRKALRKLASSEVHEIRAYLRSLTGNVVRDYLREKRNSLARNNGPDVNDRGVESQISKRSNTDRHILIKEIDYCLRKRTSGPTKERDRQIFWFYYRHGMTAKQIASIPVFGLGPEGVESVLHRLRKLVRSGLRNGKNASSTASSAKAGKD